MSAYLADYAPWSNQNGIVGKIYCDAVSDLPAQNAFPEYGTLVMSSKAYIVPTGDVYMMDSSGSWYLQPRENSVALDLSGYYTSAEVEQAITDAIRAFVVGDTIPANYDLNDFVEVGHKNCAATIANSCQNRPLGMNQTGGFGVTNSLIYTAEGTTDKVRQDLIYNVTGNNLAKNRAFWRIYSSAGWSPWFEDDKTEVVLT